MYVKKTLAVAGLLTLMGGVAACGGGGGSPASVTGAADGPTNASKTDFCATLTNIGSNPTPKGLAAAFQKVGTPSDIDAASRHGFEVLVEHLSTLDDTTKASDVQQMEAGLSTTDQADVAAFTTYLAKECLPSSTLPSSPST